MQTSNVRAYALFVLILLCFWGLRLPLLASVPPFIDEGNQIDIGVTMLQTSPLFGASEGRLTSIWYWMLFQPQQGSAFWVVRAASALLLTLNAAALMGAGRVLAGLPGMVLAGVVFTLSPYHTFFGSIALADVIAVSLLMVVVLATLLLRRRARLRDAAVAGVFLFLAVSAKVSYLPYLLIPLLGAVTLRPAGRLWRAQVVWAGAALGVFAVLYAGFAGVQFWRGYNPLSILLRGGGETDTLALLGSLPAQVFGRTVTVLGVHMAYAGWVAGVLSLVLVLVYVWQRRFYLPLVLVVPGAAVIVSQQFFSRYIYPHVMLALLIGAVVLAWALRWRAGRVIVPVLVAAWGVLVWVPFYASMLRAPELPAVPPDDISEYYAADSAGSGMAVVTAFLIEQDTQRVIGLLPNCTSLRYTAMPALPVDCPRINPNGEDIPALLALVEANRAPGVMVVHENSPYVPAQIPGTAVFTYERPGGLTTLTVVDLAP